MDDLPRIAFLLVAFAAFLLRYVCAGRSDQPRSPKGLWGREQDAFRSAFLWRSPIALGAYFAALIAAVLHIVNVYYASDPAAILQASGILRYTGALINIVLAVICGILIYDFYAFLEANAAPTTVAVLARLLPLLFVTTFGLFNADLMAIIARIQRVPTPYGPVEFKEISEREKVMLFRLSPEPTSTDFQRGTQAFKFAMTRAKTDLEHFAIFCGLPHGPYCGPTISTNRPRIAVYDYGNPLVDAMALTYDYADHIEHLSLCLDIYAKYYENGVPIQDDISEIAASYATLYRSEHPDYTEQLLTVSAEMVTRMLEEWQPTVSAEMVTGTLEEWKLTQGQETAGQYVSPVRLVPLPDALVRRRPEEGNTTLNQKEVQKLASRVRSDPLSEPLERLLWHLENFARWLKNSNEWERTLTNSDEEGNCQKLPTLRQILDDIEKMSDNTVVLPYRPMLASALLTASGYPAEASGNLERELDKLSKTFLEDRQESEYMDFIEFTFKIRLLEALQESYRQSEDRPQQLKYLNKLRKLSQRFIEKTLNLAPTRFGDILEKCENESLFDLTRGDQGISSRKFGEMIRDRLNLSSLSQKQRDWQWRNYVHGFLHFYINTELIWLDSIAWQVRDSVTDIELMEGQEFWKIATERPSVIEGCFSRLRYGEPGLYASLRFAMAYHYGLLLAQKGVRLSQAAVLATSASGERKARAVGEGEARRLMCAGAAALRRAYVIGQDIPKSSDWRDGVEPKLFQAESMLRELAKVDCSE